MTRADIAIYAPEAAALYERRPKVSGGAERQTLLLARGLAGLGRRVAHIVLPLTDPAPPSTPAVTVVQLRPFEGAGHLAERGLKLASLWRALKEADAETYVFRTGLAALGVTAAFCRVHRRRLVFAAASDLDFTFAFYDGRPLARAAYASGVRLADAVVVQSGRQIELARAAFPTVRTLVHIPSFAEPATQSQAAPEAFLWTGRLDHFKQPLRYLDLAEALPEARFWLVPKFLHERPPLEREVRRRAERLPNVEILDARPHAEAMLLIEQSVAVVNTGAAEGMPNMFLEAWARGIPVASFEFDPDDLISSRGLGVSAGGSREAFVAGVRELWESRFDRRSLADRVRAYVTEVHGQEVVSRKWASLIEALPPATRTGIRAQS